MAVKIFERIILIRTHSISIYSKTNSFDSGFQKYIEINEENIDFSNARSGMKRSGNTCIPVEALLS